MTQKEINGLSTAKAQELRKIFGLNEVSPKEQNLFILFLKKFWAPSAWMIEAIVLLSFALKKNADGFVALGLLIINAVISFLEERRTQNAVKLLKQKLSIKAKVLRDGHWIFVLAKEIVPSDIIRVRLGDIIPADIKILEGEIEIDQSMLTGESISVTKSKGETAYSGSLVRRGECTGLVLEIGAKSFFGQTVQLVQTTKTRFHLDEIVNKMVRWLFLIIGSLVFILVIAAIIDQNYKLIDLLSICLVLLMSAIPVSLPVMLSISTAKASFDLGGKGILVTRLSATLDAATMDILCADKTGTITKNQLVLAKLIPLSGFIDKDLLLYAALASDQADQDPIDNAILQACEKEHIASKDWQIKEFIPFSPETRRTESKVLFDSVEMTITKGAVLSVAKWCDEKDVSSILQITKKLGSEGYRSIAVGQKLPQKRSKLVGILAFYDPPKPDSKPLIAHLQSLGIKVKMLTGDALPVALAIASSIGLHKILSVTSNFNKILDMLNQCDGLADVYPDTKLKVIHALQSEGHIVGMTGDGVNDAPSLKRAEVGIAVAKATDVAKASASVVLTKDGLDGIISLVESGRMVYQRILTWMINKISRSLLKSGLIVLSYFIFGQLVTSAMAILLIVLMTDFAKMALAFDHVNISKKPDTWKVGRQGFLGAILGVFMIVESLFLLVFGQWYLGIDLSSKNTHTYVFLILLFMGIFSILSIRERKRFWSSFPSIWLLLSLGINILIGVLIGCFGFLELPPLPFETIILVLGISCLFSLVLNDFLKYSFIKILEKS